MILGVDEVGMGALAGPVTVAGVILEDVIVGVRDSKLIREELRYSLADEIESKAQFCFRVSKPNTDVDRDGLDLTWGSCVKAIVDKAREKFPDCEVVLDGNKIPPGIDQVTAVVKGDSLVYQVSAASIVAKAHRDRLMAGFDAQYPGYEFTVNKGYPTKKHLEALKRLGPCPVHRMSYRPVRDPSHPIPREEYEFNADRANSWVATMKDIATNAYASDWEKTYVLSMAARLQAGEKLSPRQMFFLSAVARRRYHVRV